MGFEWNDRQWHLLQYQLYQLISRLPYKSRNIIIFFRFFTIFVLRILLHRIVNPVNKEKVKISTCKDSKSYKRANTVENPSMFLTLLFKDGHSVFFSWHNPSRWPRNADLCPSRLSWLRSYKALWVSLQLESLLIEHEFERNKTRKSL